jgi:hypothetical protein
MPFSMGRLVPGAPAAHMGRLVPGAPAAQIYETFQMDLNNFTIKYWLKLSFTSTYSNRVIYVLHFYLPSPFFMLRRQ